MRGSVSPSESRMTDLMTNEGERKEAEGEAEEDEGARAGSFKTRLSKSATVRTAARDRAMESNREEADTDDPPGPCTARLPTPLRPSIASVVSSSARVIVKRLCFPYEPRRRP